MKMFNWAQFISNSMTYRPESMSAANDKASADLLTREIKSRKVCVIGGAGSIGSSFIKAVLLGLGIVVFNKVQKSFLDTA